MRRPLALAAALGAALAIAPAALADETVVFTSDGFAPNSVTVRAGERVIFRNDTTSPRRAWGDHGRFQTPVLRPGESYVHRFDDRGLYGFFDSRYERRRGAVVVDPAIERVTISASPESVEGGAVVTLAGRISNGRAGQEVTVLRRFPTEPRFNISDQLVTTAGGRWSVEVEAVPGARFRAQWARVLSPVVRVRAR